MRIATVATLLAFSSAALTAQEGASPPFTPPSNRASAAPLSQQLDYVCPMDRDIRSKTQGVCPRCGMKLVPGIPEFREYPVALSTEPKLLKPGQKTRLTFQVGDPETGKPVRDFEIVHERLYHLFVISQDLSFFVHEHPEMQPDGSFQIDLNLLKPGFYRVLSDFYPAAGTPQLVSRALLVPGDGFTMATAKLEPDLAAQQAENIKVELVTEPRKPLSGTETRLFFRLTPKDGVEPYLGAMAHMLAASPDLIDLIHDHPVQVTDSPAEQYLQIQFDVIFPRAAVHRVWVQFQRKGVVNTVAFNVPVTELR